MTQDEVNTQAPEPDVPVWLRDALDIEPSPEFREKTRAAKNVARGLILLRLERERIGLRPCTLANYVKALALLWSIDVTPVLAWFGLRNLETIDENSAGGIGRFLQRLGVPRDDIGEILTFSVADAIPLAAFDDDRMGKHDWVLAEVKRGLTGSDLSRLRTIEDLVLRAYDADK